MIANPKPRKVDIKTTSRVRGTPCKILKKDHFSQFGYYKQISKKSYCNPGFLNNKNYDKHAPWKHGLTIGNKLCNEKEPASSNSTKIASNTDDIKRY